MGDRIWGDIIAVATAIVSLAVIAVLVSKQANTSAVVTAATNGFAADLKAAVSPIASGGLSLT